MKVKEATEKIGLKLNIQKTKVMGPSPITSWQIEGEKEEQWHILFSWDPKSLCTVTAARKLKELLAPWKKSNDKPRQYIKKQRHYFAYRGPYSQSYGFSSSHVWMWESDHEQRWMPKNWWFQIVVPENTNF